MAVEMSANRRAVASVPCSYGIRRVFVEVLFLKRGRPPYAVLAQRRRTTT